MYRLRRSDLSILTLITISLATILLAGSAYAAPITMSGTLTDQDTSNPITNTNVGFTRVANLGSGNPGDLIPIEITEMTNGSGYFELEVDDGLPGLDQVLVFTRAYGYVNELYHNVQFSGTTPTYADVALPGVVAVDFTSSVSGVDFALEPSATGGKTTYMVEMTDGTDLATDVYLPDGTGPWPVVLYRTPYDKNSDGVGSWPSWNNSGYVVVSQDIRGCYGSEDIFRGFYDDGWGANKDGYDTVVWILAQTWCNGQIGSIGGSARGISQNMLAGSVPPGLVCQHVGVATSNFFTQAIFQGGEYRRKLAEGWMGGRGPEALQYLHDVMMAHPTYDSYWVLQNFEDRYSLVNWPMVNVGGWYDIFLQGTINNFVGIQHNGQPGADGNQKLVIGPYGHGDGDGGFDWPAGGAPAAYGSSMAWLNYWIKGMSTGVMDQPPVCYYVLGDVDDLDGPGNEWRFADDWPVPATDIPFYFHQGGVLNTARPTGSEPSDTYVYDPTDPVPNLGGRNLSDPNGPYDQRPVESRDDVILFTTPVLQEYVEITGKVLVTLHASSDALDTDFTAILCDVYPDGRSMNVCDGIIRARLRNSMTTEELMVPGTIYEFEIDLWETCIAFNAGHRIRVEISSSNYPRFDANPNTGEPFNQHTHTVPATNTIYHDAAYPSHILFRVTGPDANDDGVADIADLDEDGMPDLFEQLIIDFNTGDGIDTIDDVLPGDDFDGDGRTNYDEYVNGTDPTSIDLPLRYILIPVAAAMLLLAAKRGTRLLRDNK